MTAPDMTTPATTTPLRVVQWATGNIGTRALRAVIRHPGLDLAGVLVHAPAKDGRDAGDLCGLPPTGIIATRDLSQILALGADCVLYMPAACDYDQVCALLAAGANVVTTRGEFHWPASMDPAARTQVEAACQRGSTTLHSTGSSPGFITEAVPLVLTSIQRELHALTISEFADLSQRDSPDLLLRVMGFGNTPADLDPRRLNHGKISFGPSLMAVADALGLPLDDVEATGEIATASAATRIAAGTLAAGTVAAQRMTVTGLRAGRPLLTFRATWYCTPDLDPAWDLRPTGWHIHIDGDAPLDVDLRFAVPLERMAESSPAYTANRAVNAIPYVCAAPPGITTAAALPQIIATLS
jgi:hypothetical protein